MKNHFSEQALSFPCEPIKHGVFKQFQFTTENRSSANAAYSSVLMLRFDPSANKYMRLNPNLNPTASRILALASYFHQIPPFDAFNPPCTEFYCTIIRFK